MPRPPKQVRDAMKAIGEWDFEPTPPPFDPVAAFCAGEDDTIPMPGAYESFFDPQKVTPPAYFESGPLFGDAPEDVETLLGHEIPNPQIFAEMGWDGAGFTSTLFSTAYTAAAVQLSVAHEGMGFGKSRLSDLTQWPIKLPECLALSVETLGEFVGPDDRKWFYRDFSSQVEALMRSAWWLALGQRSLNEVRDLFWLPTRVDDGRTAAYIAVALSKYFHDRGFQIPESELIGTVFSGDIPPSVAAIARQLPVDEFKALQTLFQVFSSDREFHHRYSTGPGSRAIALLGFEWDRPRVSDMMFHIDVADKAKQLSTSWVSLQNTIERGLNVTMRKVTYRDLGDPWQVMFLSDRPGGVEVSTFYSLTTRVANFRACFGSPVQYASVPMRQRATGRIDARAQRVSLLRNQLGLD